MILGAFVFPPATRSIRAGFTLEDLIEKKKIPCMIKKELDSDYATNYEETHININFFYIKNTIKYYRAIKVLKTQRMNTSSQTSFSLFIEDQGRWI